MKETNILILLLFFTFSCASQKERVWVMDTEYDLTKAQKISSF